MGKKFKGVNTKVQAANERKAAAKAEKAEKAAAVVEKQLAAEWSVGANHRGKQRQDSQEQRKQEQDRKAREKKELLEKEEAQLKNVKTVKGATKRTKAQKQMDKPWEAALKPVVKKNNRGSSNVSKKTQPPATSVKIEEKPVANTKIVFGSTDIQENRNRMEEGDDGR